MTRVLFPALGIGLLLTACAAGSESASSPYCDDYARSHSRLYGVHYSITEHLDEMDAWRATCLAGHATP